MKSRTTESKSTTSRTPQEITSESIQYQPGIDTYLSPGNTVNGLILEAIERKAFFAEHKELHHLLLREDNNPILEEGKFTAIERSHEGEYYLSYEALTLLVENKIRKHKHKKGGLPYNTKNIFIIKNDEEKLKNILQELTLTTEEDAKFIYIEGIHAVAFYLRNENGLIKAFIVDSEGHPDNIIKCIQTIYPSAHIILNGTHLQNDYSSCSTFAFKTLMYFVKHGSEVFPYLEKVLKDTTEVKNCRRLLPDRLMPSLLKMVQSKLDLSEEVLKSRVSHKSKQTLQEYWQKYRVTIADKQFNSAALVKRYSYFTSLDSYINKLLNLGVSISPDQNNALPKNLHGIHSGYSREVIKRNTAYTNDLIEKYIKIADYLDAEAKPLLEQSQSLYQLIINKFPEFNLKYAEKFDPHKKQKETSLLKKVLYIAAYVEVIDLAHIDLYLQFANKLLRLFNNENQALDYLKKNIPSNTAQPLHDICLFKLPRHDDWDKNYWAQFVLKFGTAATKYLSQAPLIDKMREGLTTEEAKTTTSIDDFQLISRLATQIKYKRGHEYPALADLCLTHVTSEKDFETTLNLLQKHHKKFDLLPNIEIKGSDINEKFARFRFVKLPVTDLRGLFLGEYTSCCQSIGKIGENCAIHGMTSIYSGFYVVFERDSIVAQTWAWIGAKCELVFDSWEFIHKGQDYLCQLFIEKAAKIILPYGFSRILLGKGGHTPHLGLSVVAQTELAKPKSYAGYSDANDKQYIIEIASNNNLEGKFQIFCETVNIDATQYRHLFKEPIEEFYFEQELLKLVMNKKMPFDDFFHLYQFVLRLGNEFLYKINPIVHQLMSVLYDVYQEKIFLFHAAQSSEKTFILDLICVYHDLQLVQKILAIKNDQGTINDLVYSAIKNDALAILTYLYEKYYPEITWQAFILLEIRDNQSIFQHGIQYNATACIKFFLKKTIDINALTSLLNTKSKDGFPPLHILAKHNSIDVIKSIYDFYSAENNHDITNFFQLLDNEALINGFKGPVVVSALSSCSIDVAQFILRNFYKKAHHSYWLAVKNDRNKRLIDIAIEKDNLNLLKFIHTCCVDVSAWHVLISQLTTYNKTILHYAIGNNAMQCLFYILDHFNDVEKLHRLLLIEDVSYHALEYLKNLSTENIVLLFDRILSIYSNDFEKFSQLVIRKYWKVFSILLQNNLIGLFNKILNFITQDRIIANKLIQEEERYNENLLDWIISLHAGLSVDDIDFIPCERKIQFIDSILKHFSTDQLKTYLQSNSYLRYCSGPILQYLLNKLDECKNDDFRHQWLYNKDGNDDQAPFFRAITRHASDGHLNATDVILNYYLKFYGKDETNQLLLKNLNDVFVWIGHADNLILLQYIYPLFKLNQINIGKLLRRIIKQNHTKSYSNAALTWLLEQSEINLEILSSAFNIKITNYHFQIMQTFLQMPNKATIKLLWNACKNKLTDTELQQLIQSHFLNHYKQLLTDSKYTLIYSCEKHEFKTRSYLLDIWLQTATAPFDLIMQRDAQDKNLFNYACENQIEAMIRSMLLHVKPHEQQQLIETQLALTTNQKDKDQLVETFLVVKKINQLFKLKTEKEIISTEYKATDHRFFKQVSPLSSLLKEELKTFFTKSPLHIKCAKVNQLWEKAKHSFPSINEILNDPFISRLQGLPSHTPKR